MCANNSVDFDSLSRKWFNNCFLQTQNRCYRDFDLGSCFVFSAWYSLGNMQKCTENDANQHHCCTSTLRMLHLASARIMQMLNVPVIEQTNKQASKFKQFYFRSQCKCLNYFQSLLQIRLKSTLNLAQMWTLTLCCPVLYTKYLSHLLTKWQNFFLSVSWFGRRLNVIHCMPLAHMLDECIDVRLVHRHRQTSFNKTAIICWTSHFFGWLLSLSHETA